MAPRLIAAESAVGTAVVWPAVMELMSPFGKANLDGAEPVVKIVAELGVETLALGPLDVPTADGPVPLGFTRS